MARLDAQWRSEAGLRSERAIIESKAEEPVMTVRLELKPEVEATLTDQAKAKGVALNAYLQNVIDDLARAHSAPKPDIGENRAALDRLAEMGKRLPHVPSSTFRRESIYQDRD